MRSISHVGTVSTPIATEAPPPKATGTSPHRRVMRAAWTLHRTCGGAFSEALKQAWRHEKARAGFSAAEALQDEIVRSAYLSSALSEMKSAFPIEDYHFHTRRSRNIIAGLIDRLISMLDEIDGDPDFEDDRCDFECDARRLAQITAAPANSVQIARS